MIKTLERRVFQIHLSTSIVLMFAASAFGWANLRLVPNDDNRVALFYVRGFPIVMNRANRGWQTSLYWSKPENLAYNSKMRASMPSGFEGQWFVLSIFLNAMFAIAAIGSIVVGWEYVLQPQRAREQ